MPRRQRRRAGRYEELHRARKKRLWKVFFLTLFCIFLLAYIAIAVYFRQHFYKGTVLYGADCSNMTAVQAKDAVSRKLSEYKLEILQRENKSETVTAKQIGLQFVDDGAVRTMLKNQRCYIWPLMVFGRHQTTAAAAFSYDKEAVESAVDSLDCMDASLAVQPQDARLAPAKTGFVVEPEVMGTLLDREKTLEAVFAALDRGDSQVSLEETNCYQSPAVFADDEALQQEAKELNEIAGADITLDFGDRQEIVGSEQIREWMYRQDDGSYALDEEMVSNYVSELAHKYDTFGLGREFHTSLGSTVSLFGGDYGWLMDQDETCYQLLDAIYSKYQGVLEPAYIYSAMSRNTDDIGDTYVEVCISQQRMWCYENGVLMVDTPVVTGNPNTNHGTPSGGVWAIDSKMREYTLRGEDYAAPVDYWMAFNGDVGIHDLISRTEFGGQIYLTGGSHGCVNTPYEAVQTIYSIVSVGTPVVVYD